MPSTMIENDWNVVTEWFANVKKRRIMISYFNSASKDAFVSGIVPSLLEATVTIGESKYKHELSKFFASGLRIKVVSGQEFTKEQCILLGTIILANDQIARLLIVLGWDTLEIGNNKIDGVGLKWELKKFAQLR